MLQQPHQIAQRAVCLARLSPRWSRLFSASAGARSAAAAAPAKEKHYYATTPIFYVNAAPHIGHLHTTVLADVFTRFQSLRHPTRPKPILLTGTDEHGLKIQRVAEAAGETPKALCDRVSQTFLKLASDANIDYTIFMRTTEPRHRVAVEHIWRELVKKGLIYKSSYAGWYAVSDEAYYPSNQVEEVVDAATGEKFMASIETGTRVEWMEEDNYKFALSSFRERLVEWLSQTPSPLQPPARAAALLSALSQADSADLSDLSISRPAARLSWGIPVPDDGSHTIYVWLEALVNYLTGAGYPHLPSSAYSEGQVWPPDLQIIGKDIVRFHALYLPAVLMALDLPLPKQLLAHGHWTMDKFKMSKSRGNVANPLEAIEKWGLDPVRCFLMRAGGDASRDADWSVAEIDKFYRKDLAGQMGNLLSRIEAKKMIARLPTPEALYTRPEKVEQEDERLVELLETLPAQFEAHMANLDVHKALGSAFDALYEANRYLQLLSPWLVEASPEVVHRALFYASETLRISAVVLEPVMPTKTVELLDALGVSESGRKWDGLGLGEGGARSLRGGKKVYLFPSVAEV